MIKKEGSAMRKQKGQAVVEFALVLPLFFMFFWGIVYTGLLYSDYLTLSNLARESARAASIQGAEHYEEIRTGDSGQKLLTDLYHWNGDESSFKIENGANTSVKVTLTANLNRSFPGVGIMDFLGMSLPEKYTIVYSMYKEASS